MAGVRISADCLRYLEQAGDDTFGFIYIDPPFNTGSKKIDAAGEYRDSFDHGWYLSWLRVCFEQSKRVLCPIGSIAVHLDWRESHYARVLLDDVFGRDAFVNEIVWSYDFGGRGKRCWPRKHDTICVYAKTPNHHYFDWDAIPRVPYMSALSKNPRFVTAEKAKRGKALTDVWWRSVIGTSSNERTGYPTQKPVEIVKRLVDVHAPPSYPVLDYFAGSGTTGAACISSGRDFVLVDSNPQAHEVMSKRFGGDVAYVDGSIYVDGNDR